MTGVICAQIARGDDEGKTERYARESFRMRHRVDIYSRKV
jgi:hypothetical protein